MPADDQAAAYSRLAAMLAEGQGLDDAQPMYSPLGELRQFKAEYDRLRAQLDDAESALRSALEDCHPSVEAYFKRHPEADRG